MGDFIKTERFQQGNIQILPEERIQYRLPFKDLLFKFMKIEKGVFYDRINQSRTFS